MALTITVSGLNNGASDLTRTGDLLITSGILPILKRSGKGRKVLILQGFSALWVVYRGVSFGDSLAACVTKLAPSTGLTKIKAYAIIIA